MRVRFKPFGHRVDVMANTSLLEAANAAGVEIEAICGGRGTCGKCRVVVDAGRYPDSLSPHTEAERKHLTDAERAQGYRLACQARVLGDVEVTVAEEARITQVSILAEGIGAATAGDPWVRRHHLLVPEATLEEQIADLDNVARVWQAQAKGALRPALCALQQLPRALRECGGRLTALQVDDEIVRFEAGDGPERLLGIAFDIGTTTVVGYLMDLESGEQLAFSSRLNPQTRYGDDVVSRIDYASRAEGGLATLQGIIIEALNEIIADTTAAAAVDAQDILAMTVVGNTTMQHLFLGINPEALATAPYVPVVVDAVCLRASELGIAIYPQAHVWALPNIAGWVGADTVGVLLATGIWQQDELALAIDIGTNGEMAMGSRDRLIACSTAAGPAFEGAHLSCGMRAAAGAIDRVVINERVIWHTIGEVPPRGICGSGLVDVVAELLKAGVVNETGLIVEPQTLASGGRPTLAERIAQNGRQRAFRLVGEEEGASNRTLWVTQRDVRELQLAKGAIRAGIETLIKELGITHDKVRRVYLAGAFGNYIRPESALGLGLLPRFPNAEIVPVGNAAGVGAKMALLSHTARQRASELRASVEYLELSGRPDFQEMFAEAMVF